MELKLGKMSTKELAKWFNISYETFRHKKDKMLQELSFYCTFEKIYGGVIIKNISVPEYLPQTSTYDFIKRHLLNHWHKSMLDTASRVGSEIYYTYKDNELLGIKESTVKAYATKARLELFGHVYLNDYGSQGSCHPEPVVDNHWDEAEPLSDEQLKIYKECLKEAYYSEEDAMIEEAKAQGLINDVEYNEIKKDKEKNSDAIRILKHNKMVDLCIERIGFYPNQITKLEKELRFN